MNPSLHNVAVAARWVTAAALLHATLPACGQRRFFPALPPHSSSPGSYLLLVPRVWPAGALLLLGVFALAAAHHAEEGAPVVWLVYPATVIVLLVAIERAEKGRP